LNGLSVVDFSKSLKACTTHFYKIY
jgi:hypothetical protein